MNSTFIRILPLLALATGVGCGVLEPKSTSEEQAQPQKAVQASEATAAKPAASQLKAEEQKPEEQEEPIVMVQPQPMPTLPEAEAMPVPEPMPEPVAGAPASETPATEAGAEPAVAPVVADTTSEIQPAPPSEEPETIAKLQPAQPPQKTDADKKSMADELAGKGDNYFIVEIAEKDQTHPMYGQGHKLGMLLNGVQGKTIVMKRGETYDFDVRTDPLHDVYFSTSKQGWGGGTVVDGIKGQFTYKGIIKYAPNEKTPDVVYYQCRNHNSMGGKIIVVNKNTSKAEIDKLLAQDKKSRAAAGASTAKKATVSEARVKQKLSFADMMFMSKGTSRVNASDNAAAKKMLVDAKTKLTSARKALTSGQNAHALEMADEVLRLIGSASRLVPSEEVLAEQKERYLEILDAVKNFEVSHKEAYEDTLKKRGEKAAVQYDKKQINKLLADAKVFADKKQYTKAIPLLEQAENIVTSAINVMLDSQTIVYDLNFETAEEEYEYELKRFKSYEELVPVAIEQKRPAPGAVKLMDGFVAKGRSQRDSAIAKAKEGDFPTAIAMMLSATTQVRRALRIAGVSQ